MLKKTLSFSAVYLVPAAAFAGGGGADSAASATLLRAVMQLAGKIAGWF